MTTGSIRKGRFGALPWIGPAVILILVMVVWPAIEMIRTSLHEIDQTGIAKGWNGISNYRNLLHNPDLPQTLIRTVIWVAVIVSLTVLISLPVAQILHARFPGRKVVRYAIIVPWAASVVMTSTIWRWMLDGFYGLFNRILQDLGILKDPIDWLGNPNLAFIFLMVVAIFVSVPFTTYVIIAGLSTIPEEILEAARVDGATDWKRYWEIIFPLLSVSVYDRTPLGCSPINAGAN